MSEKFKSIKVTGQKLDPLPVTSFIDQLKNHYNWGMWTRETTVLETILPDPEVPKVYALIRSMDRFYQLIIFRLEDHVWKASLEAREMNPDKIFVALMEILPLVHSDGYLKAKAEQHKKPDPGFVVGEVCERDGCSGIIEEHKSDLGGCSCHVSAPCAYCTEERQFCPTCGWEASQDQTS